MKDYDNNLILLMQADEAVVFDCIDLEISDSETVHYTNFDIDIVVDGTRYETREFEVSPVNYSIDMTVDEMKLTFANQDLVMSGILLNNTVTNRVCIIYHGAMNGSTPIMEEYFRGPVSEWNLADAVDLSVSTELVYWNKKTLREPGALCPWTLGVEECTYTGGATACNGTYERCLVLGMEDDFGGARFLPSLEEKEIWWGKKPA